MLTPLIECHLNVCFKIEEKNPLILGLTFYFRGPYSLRKRTSKVKHDTHGAEVW